jgi:hypothetical protein
LHDHFGWRFLAIFSSKHYIKTSDFFRLILALILFGKLAKNAISPQAIFCLWCMWSGLGWWSWAGFEQKENPNAEAKGFGGVGDREKFSPGLLPMKRMVPSYLAIAGSSRVRRPRTMNS